MALRPPSKQSAPAEVLASLNGGYNGYTDPTQTNPKMWSAATNVLTGAFGFIQRCRFANVKLPSPLTGKPFTTLKYFALPGIGAYTIADINGKLYSYDTALSYAQTQRLNPYVDPSGTGNATLNGPWSREALGNILYEMNGTVKQAGRLANAAKIEGFGLDAPDASPQVVVGGGATTNITAIARASGVVTVTVVATAGFGVAGTSILMNVSLVTDTSFNGSFVITIVDGTHFSYTQFGQDTTSSGGTVNTSITKAIGRSYAYAWENANKFHIGAQSPATQYIQYNAQNGTLNMVEPGTVSIVSGNVQVVGVGTFFTPAWVGRSLWVTNLGTVGRILSVTNNNLLTLATVPGASFATQQFQVYDPQSTHLRIYATGDGQATYFRIARNGWVPTAVTLTAAGLTYFDAANSEPPNFPFTTETAQPNNLPPPIGQFINEYQGRLCVFGVPGALQSFFYSNQEATSIGLPQESFAPLNQVTLPIQNAQLYGMVELPGSAILWSDKQDMFRLTGLLTDNTVTGIAQSNAATQQGASIARLPYNLGCANPFAVDITPLGAIWVTSNAEVWLFTDRYAPRNIGRPIQDILNTIFPPNLKLIRAKYYHTNTRNWFVLTIPANGASFNNTVLILDLDLLASNGSPSYFTFDMATNSPSWYIWQPGTTIGGNWVNRCDALEVVYEQGGIVRLMVGQVDLIQDIDYAQGGFGTEIAVPNGTVTFHPWGNDHPFVIAKPGWIRFNTNRDPSMLASDGWTFQAIGIDDDFYTFADPLTLALTPGVNDSSTLGGNPDRLGGLAFRHSPELFKIGGVNYIAGRRLKFQVNFPSGTGVNYQFKSVQLGFSAQPPS